MYSLLIPNYNETNIRSLVRMLSYCGSKLCIDFEIIVLDDASTNETLIAYYSELNNYPNVHCYQLPENKGRTYTRNQLANIARFDWLLFMDSDTIPQTERFLRSFAEAFQQKNIEVVFGGVFYGFMPPKEIQRRLRYTFGSQRESKPLILRKNQIYLSVISTCFAIKKDVFLSLQLPQENRYGMDVLFAYQLQKNNIKVLHIESLAEIKVIDKTEDFLQKTEKAIETLHYLVRNQMIPSNYTPLLEVVRKLETWKLTRIFMWLAIRFKPQMLNNLHSEKPIMRVFDIYRLMLYLQQASA